MVFILSVVLLFRYEFRFYKYPTHLIFEYINALLFVVTETTLTMLQQLFVDYAHIPNWMVTYSATISGSITGSSSIIFQINEPPTGGSCNVDRLTGDALQDYFTVSCFNWNDTDGEITTYELNGN